MSESSADRAMRALTHAVVDARPRRLGDADDPAVPVAGTVLVLRDGDGGPEVLMIERPGHGSFSGAWVFPGGMREPDDIAGAEEGEEASARRAGIRETFEEVGLRLEAESLVTVSRWDPPIGAPKRIRTWFFAAPFAGGDLTLAPDEVVSALWARPEEMLQRQARGELTLYPPTWVTLHGLCGQSDVEALLAVHRLRGIEDFATVVRNVASSPVFLWQGDAEYEDADAPASSARHRLETSALPWTYTRQD